MSFMLGFMDELIKVAQAGPGTSVPPPVQKKHTLPGPKKFAPPKPRGPLAEGYVKGMTVSGLPKSVMKGSSKGVVSAVGERKAWEAKVKKKKSQLPAWLSDSMKRPVKGHSLATPEAVARSKREDAEAKKMVAGVLPEKPGKRMARRRRKKPVQYGSMGGRTVKGGGTTGPTGIFAPHRRMVTGKPINIQRENTLPWYVRKKIVGKPITISKAPGYKAVQKKRTI